MLLTGTKTKEKKELSIYILFLFRSFFSLLQTQNSSRTGSFYKISMHVTYIHEKPQHILLDTRNFQRKGYPKRLWTSLHRGITFSKAWLNLLITFKYISWVFGSLCWVSWSSHSTITYLQHKNNLSYTILLELHNLRET